MIPCRKEKCQWDRCTISGKENPVEISLEAERAETLGEGRPRGETLGGDRQYSRTRAILLYVRDELSLSEGWGRCVAVRRRRRNGTPK
jgi:hypothetical protein